MASEIKFMSTYTTLWLCLQLLVEQAKAKQEQIKDLEKKKQSTKVDLQHLNELKQQVKRLQEGKYYIVC